MSDFYALPMDAIDHWRVDQYLSRDVIWEETGSFGYHHIIVCHVWEQTGAEGPRENREAEHGCGEAAEPHLESGRFHSFEYQVLGMIEGCREIEVFDSFEARCPTLLLKDVPEEMQDAAQHAVMTWLSEVFSVQSPETGARANDLI